MPNSYYWRMTFDFDNRYDGLLHVVYIDANNMQHDVTAEIVCMPVGAVVHSEDTADFRGGYLDCHVPSIQAILEEMTGSQIGEIQLYCPFKIETEIIFSETQPIHPILAHIGPNLQPDAQFRVQSGSLNQLETQFSNTHLSQGAPFSPHPDFYFLQTELTKRCYFRHWVDTTSTIDPTPTNGAAFYIGAAQLFIGFDPQTGTALHGRINTLIVDPGDFIKIN